MTPHVYLLILASDEPPSGRRQLDHVEATFTSMAGLRAYVEVHHHLKEFPINDEGPEVISKFAGAEDYLTYYLAVRMELKD